MAKKAKGNFVVSKEQLSQEIDLKSYLGRKPTSNEKKLFAQVSLDTIENRTLDGDDVNGRNFKRYSPEYADFKGVTRDSVDMFLEGTMLDSMGRRSSKEKVSTVFIQMKKGKETLKAQNHQRGDTLPQREFFGITDAEAKRIAKEIKEADKPRATTTIGELRSALDLLEIEQAP